MPTPRAAPWWLLPNLLALDAPIVAVAWQRFLGAKLGANVPPAASIALFAAVWALYLADRLLDGHRGAVEADRHLVAAKSPRTYLLATLLAALLGASAALALPPETIRRGLALAVATGVYLTLIHGVAARSWGGGKEFAVAVGFGAGVAVPLALPPSEVAPPILAFTGLCWLNCRLIDRWEALRPRPTWPDALLGVALLAAAPFLPSAVGTAIVGSVLGLLLIGATCRRRPRAARALADAALLTPLACWWLP